MENRIALILKLRNDVVEVLVNSKAVPEEAAFAFGIVLAAACKPYGDKIGKSTREVRKLFEGFVSDGMKLSLDEIRRHEFKTRTVDDE